jgi:uncharacterized protein
MNDNKGRAQIGFSRGDSDSRRGSQGFGSLDPKKRRELASLGGREAQRRGTAHQWTSEEAAAAGRKSRGGGRNADNSIRE